MAVAPLAVALLVGLAAGLSACAARDEADARPVCLLTAFEPFGGAELNPSWEAVRRLEGLEVEGYRLAVLRLPVVYDEMAVPLLAAIDGLRPEVVISFGLGKDVVKVERVARNGYAASRPADNRGRTPPRDRVVPGGPETVPTALPADAILAALRAEGIGAEASDDAGGYLCNECFYRVMTLDRPAGTAPRARGFVHVPPLDGPNPMGGLYTLDRLRQAVSIVVRETLRAAGRG